MRDAPTITVFATMMACTAPGSTQQASPANPTSASDKMVGATIEHHILLSSADVKWGEGPPTLRPGAKLAVVEGDPKAPNALFTIRIKLPDEYTISPHFHPADEHITVISGTFNMGMGDAFDKNATTALPAGSFAVMPKSHHHFAWAKGETIIQVHGVGPWGITYVNAADDPRNVTAD